MDGKETYTKEKLLIIQKKRTIQAKDYMERVYTDKEEVTWKREYMRGEKKYTERGYIQRENYMKKGKGICKEREGTTQNGESGCEALPDQAWLALVAELCLIRPGWR